MKVIYLKDNVAKPKTLSISKAFVASVAMVFLFFSIMLVMLGVTISNNNHDAIQHYESAPAYQMEQDIAVEKENLENLRVDLKNNLTALSARLGALQAQVSRINAVEKRLATAAKIDIEAFDFNNEPAQGGAEDISIGVDAESLSQDILSMEDKLAEREAAIESLGVSLSEMILKAGQTPEGLPVKKGWISSRYGWRTSPVTGRKQFHRGVDVPARRGADVIAVADGVVIRVERQKALGNLVEINHGDGMRTLYAHNSKNLVTIGQSVSKGDKIAEVGSTGRSTGPHVHFQVYKDGKIVDPKPFIK